MNLKEEKYKNNNILLYPNANGIGDFIQVLVSGFIIFKGESFELISGKGGYPQRYMPHYEDFFVKLSDSFSLCSGFHYLDYLSYGESVHLKDILEKKGYHVYLMKNDQIFTDGRKQCNENALKIMKNVKKYFDFSKITKSTNDIIKSDKRLKICVFLRYYNKEIDSGELTLQKCILRQIEKNNSNKIGTTTDLNKWQKYILWLQNKYKCQLFLIGERDKSSPYYISVEKLNLINSNSNIKVLFHDSNTDIRHDLHALLKCDGLIGGTGTMIWTAMLFGKPVLNFDMPVYPISKAPIFYNINLLHQLYDYRNLTEMQEKSYLFIKNVVNPVKKHGIESVFHSHDKAILSFLNDLINVGIPLNRLNGWRNYHEAYFLLSKMFLSIENYEMAEELLDKIDDSIYKNEKELYYLGRELKDKERFRYATKILKKALSWAQATNDKNFISASYFHLGEILYIEKKFDEALVYFLECVQILPSHKTAGKYILEILIVKKKDIIACDLSLRESKILENKKLKLLNFENIFSKDEYNNLVLKIKNPVFVCSNESISLVKKKLENMTDNVDDNLAIILNADFLKFYK